MKMPGDHLQNWSTEDYKSPTFTIAHYSPKVSFLFTLTWVMTNDFQVEFFSFNYQKQWKLSVCKKSLTKLE